MYSIPSTVGYLPVYVRARGTRVVATVIMSSAHWYIRILLICLRPATLPLITLNTVAVMDKILIKKAASTSPTPRSLA